MPPSCGSPSGNRAQGKGPQLWLWCLHQLPACAHPLGVPLRPPCWGGGGASPCAAGGVLNGAPLVMPSKNHGNNTSRCLDTGIVWTKGGGVPHRGPQHPTSSI